MNNIMMKHQRATGDIITNMSIAIPRNTHSHIKNFERKGVLHTIDTISGILILQKDNIYIELDTLDCHSVFKKGELFYETYAKKRKAKETLDDIINRPGNRNILIKWTEAELEILKICLEAGIREKYIAMLLARGRISVERRAQRMGIFPKGKRE